jgi:hypothetical protein
MIAWFAETRKIHCRTKQKAKDRVAFVSEMTGISMQTTGRPVDEPAPGGPTCPVPRYSPNNEVRDTLLQEMTSQ